MNMKSKLMRITIPAIMAAMSVVLEMVAFNTGWTKVTLHGIPLMFTGIMFGPSVGCLTGLTAGLLAQLKYPFSIASLVYPIAYIMWAVIPGFFAKFFKDKRAFPLIVLAVVFASIFANLTNTGAMMIDALFVDGSYLTVAGILAKWGTRIITMILMLLPNIFLLERLIIALTSVIVFDEITIDDFNISVFDQTNEKLTLKLK